MKRQEDLVYDVGMHLGEDSAFYLAKGFRVVGFEADPDLARRCRTRFASEIDCGRLTLIEGAVVDSERLADSGGAITFHRNPEVTVWGTVADEWAERNAKDGAGSEQITVPTVDFGACLREHGVPHYLKIDIEGMDRACLEACMPFEAKPSYVSIESEKVSFKALLEELELLRDLGFVDYQAVQQKDVHRQREPRPAREGAFVGQRFEKGSTGLFGADLPDRWLDYAGVLREYERIFWEYRLFGDHGTLRGKLHGRILRALLRVVTRRHIPGWYDTHARHATASRSMQMPTAA